MMSFYASIIFIGILLIFGSLVMILFDRKKSNDYIGKLDDKQKELEQAVADAEQMLEEMNRFSDYIVTQMEIKNQEFVGSLQNFEQKAGTIIKSSINTLEEVNVVKVEVPKKKTVSVKSIKEEEKQFQKIVPINAKHKQVIDLVEKGLDSSEIARQLNIGKGEIQLIMQMNR